MTADQITEALEAAAAQLGIRVRYETMTGENAGGGGLCRVKGVWQVIVDRRATSSERAGILAEALAGFDTDTVFLPPKVRDLVQQHRKARPASG